LHGFLIQSAFRSLKLWPAAADYVAQMKYKPKPRFTSGFILPNGEDRQNLVGRLLPQPMIIDAQGRRQLLDEALGSGFVLLIRGERAEARSAAGRCRGHAHGSYHDDFRNRPGPVRHVAAPSRLRATAAPRPLCDGRHSAGRSVRYGRRH
jgi:hypothetical protein